MSESKVQFLPFSAINIFMRPDYRLEVVRYVFDQIPSERDDDKKRFNQFIKKFVSVPGFRNSSLAPNSLKIKQYVSAFETHPELASFTMDIWARSKNDLLENVYSLLVDRGWEILPKDADRTKLPGFLTKWPENEDFEGINKAYQEKYEGVVDKDDDVSLMAVWLSGRLPYEDKE